jgi:hypothetical protein
VSPRAATTRRGRDEGLAKSGPDPSLPWVRRQADKTPNASRPMDCHQREVMVLSEFPLYEGLGSVKADPTSTCQTCGARVPAGLDFCPVCALLRAGGQESAPSEALNPVPDSERNSAETEPSSIVRRFENYEVMLDQDGNPIELGRGAMGITYKAFDVDLRFPADPDYLLSMIHER